MQTYLAQGADPNSETDTGETPLGLAAQSNNVSVVRALLSDPPASRRPSKQGTTKPQRKESVVYKKALVDLPNSKGETPLQIAAKLKGINIRVVNELLKNDADVHKLSLEALLTQENAIELAPVVVKAGLDPNKRTADGDTLLCKAAATGNSEMMDILLSKCDADPNMKGKNGKSPLKVATEKGHTTLLDILYNKGALDDFSDRCLRCFTSPSFKHGLFGCCDNGGLQCCVNFHFGYPCTFAKTWSNYGMCGGACGGLICANICGICSMFLLRREAAKKSGIEESCCGTCCAVVCCSCCSFFQVYNESIAQGIAEKGDVGAFCTDEDFWCDRDCFIRDMDCCANDDEDEGCCSLAICCPCFPMFAEGDGGDNAMRCSSTYYICCSGMNLVLLPVLGALGCLTVALVLAGCDAE